MLYELQNKWTKRLKNKIILLQHWKKGISIGGGWNLFEKLPNACHCINKNFKKGLQVTPACKARVFLHKTNFATPSKRDPPPPCVKYIIAYEMAKKTS